MRIPGLCSLFAKSGASAVFAVSAVMAISSLMPVSEAVAAGCSAPTTQCAPLLSLGQNFFYTDDGYCFESLECAEAHIRADVASSGPKGRHLLEPDETQLNSAGNMVRTYRVKKRISTYVDDYYASFTRYTCPNDGSIPLTGARCESENALQTHGQSVLNAPSSEGGDGLCSAVWTIGAQPQTTSFLGITEPIAPALFQGIPWQRWLVLLKSDSPPPPSGVVTHKKRDLITDACTEEPANPFVLAPLRYDLHLCEEFFEGDFARPNNRWPFLCLNREEGAITEKALQADACPAKTEHPCVPSTGQKLRHEVDLSMDGFLLERHYHSGNQLSSRSGLGDSWTHNYDTHLTSVTHQAYQPPVGAAVAAMYVVDERGELEQFQWVSTDLYRSINKSGKTLRKRGTPLMWELQADERRTLFYDNVTGVLKKIAYRDQPTRDLVLAHDFHNRLLSVTDARGRQLKFDYNGWQLTKVTAPDGSEYLYSQDTAGRLAGVGYPGGGVRSFVYDNVDFPKHLTGIFDENGHHYGEFAYDTIGRVVSSKLKTGIVAAPYAESVSLVYNPIVAGVGTTTVTTALGEQLTYTFGTGLFQRLGGVSDSAGATSTVYRSDGRIDYTVDKKGVRTGFDYDTLYQTVRIEAQNQDTQPANALSNERKIETSWDANLDVVTERRTYNCSAPNATAQACNTAASTRWQLEALSRFAYNARGQVTARCEVDPGNSTAMAYVCGSTANAPAGVRQTRTFYCEAADVTAGTCPLLGLVTSMDGARTNATDTTSTTYRAADEATCATAPTSCPYRKGDLWKVTNALNQVTEYVSYDGAGRVTRMKDANAVLTDLTYHARGWLLTRTVRANATGAPSTSDATTTLTYDNVGQVTRITQPDGAFINYTYDTAHRLTTIADNLGNSIGYTLDAAGNRTGENTRDPSNVLTRTMGRVYDSLGRLQKLLNAQNAETVFTYDANGNQNTVTDALTRVTDNDVDPLNRLIQSTDALMGNTQYRYDARDNLTQVTDAKNLSTQYVYNGLSDLAQLVSPDTGTTNYTYDSAGNRATQTDARSVVSTYGYDALNRLTAITYPTATNNVAFTYDQNHTECPTTPNNERFGIGRLTGFTDPSGSTKLCYDLRGNITRKIAVVNGVTLTTRWSYGLADRTTQLVYPSGNIVSYTRDTLGRISEISVTPAGSSAQTLISAVSYYPFGPVKQITWGNGATSLRSYDQNYWIDSINSSQATGLDLDFTLDPVGNITGLSDVIGGTPPNNTYTYDPLYRLVDIDTPTSNVETYTYDAIGNRLSKAVAAAPAASYVYGVSSHRLLGTNGNTNRAYDANGNTTSTNTASNVGYVFDQRNRLTARTVAASNTHTYRHNARGERVLKLDVANSANSRQFGYDESGRLIAELGATGTALQEFIWLDDLPVGLLAGTTLHHLQPDHLGSPRKVIQSSTNTAIWNWPILNNPFGETAPNQDPDGNSVAFILNLRFPGQYFDAETGLHYNYFRDYESGTGRYVESDPIGLWGGISTFTYTNSSPIKYVDPKGLLCFNPGDIEVVVGKHPKARYCRPRNADDGPSTSGTLCRASCVAAGAALCSAGACACTAGSVITVGGVAIPCTALLLASCTGATALAQVCSDYCPR